LLRNDFLSSQALLRIGKADYDSELARKHGALTRWYHPQCFVSRRVELKFFDAGYMIAHFETLRKEDKKYIVDYLPNISDPDL
jgi:hypothetical protein